MALKIGVVGLKGLPAIGGAASVGEVIYSNMVDDEIFVYSMRTYVGENELKLKQIVLPIDQRGPFYVFIYYIVSAIHTLFCNYDVVHLHHRDAAFVIPIIKIRHKVVVTIHNSFHYNTKWGRSINKIFEFNEKYLLRYADRVTCVSTIDVAKFKEYANIDTIFIPNPVKFFTMDCDKTRLPTDIGESYLFAANRIIELKGLHLLLNALIKIKYKRKIYVIGNIDGKSDYGKLITSLIINNNLDVTFTGLIKSKLTLRCWVESCYAFIFPSLKETMSMMLLEALSTGNITIVSNIAENKAVCDSLEKIYFESESIDSLSDALDFVDRNRTTLKMTFSNNKNSIYNDYNSNQIASDYTKVFYSVL